MKVWIALSVPPLWSEPKSKLMGEASVDADAPRKTRPPTIRMALDEPHKWNIVLYR
jgi:hypothetical protein